LELFRLLGTIVIDNSTANKEIDETTDKAERSHGKMSAFFGKIGTAAVKMGAAVGTAAVTAGTALTKMAVDSYADYEQLVGGVETLFKESQKKVMEYADNAYKTAGMSANEYMETVTSFSASLLQSLGGDTAAAADVADRAITDMSDNANKMGSSMESIQNAYQGFAKQNYTMLDNLKLGYGGTKEEMERLLEDAEKLSGVKYDMSSFADIVEAIHVVQNEMGITGTTAREASSTIQGSAAAMKSAWKNLLTGIAAENQDMELLFKNLYDSVVTYAGNIIPRVKTTLEGLMSLVKQVAPEIVQKLLSIIKEKAPKMLSAGFDLLKKLTQGLMDALPDLIEKVPTIIQKIVQTLMKYAPEILAAGVELLEILGKGILKAVPALLKSMKTIGSDLLKGLWSGMKSVWSSVSSWVSSKLEWITQKFQAVKNFLSGITSAISSAATESAETRAAKSNSKVLAHAAGGILTKPTIFGYTPATDTYHLGGEAGAEAVAPIDKLQGYVAAAVAAENNQLAGKLDDLIDLTGRMLQKVIDSNQHNVTIDGSTLVGWMDKKMAQQQSLRLRGV